MNQESHSALLELISKPMHLLGLKLIYQRTPSFCALLKAQGIKYQTIVSKRKNLITGLFSISTAPRYFSGESKSVAYLGDFRIEKDRKIAHFWRQHYAIALELFSLSPELNQPQIFLTAILQNNISAKKSLVENPKRPRSFQYHFLRSVQMVNVVSKRIARFGKSKNSVRYARSDEELRIRDFISLEERKKHLGFDFESNNFELWNHRKNTFPAFEVTRFVIVEDSQQKLLAVTLPWSPDSIKRMILKDLNKPLKFFLSLLSVFGVRVPKQNESLKTLYLTHLNLIDSVNPKNTISEILDWLGDQQSTNGYHMISFANWWNVSWKRYLHYSIEVNLFEVTSGLQTAKSIGNGENLVSKPFGFEMALV